MKKISRVEMVKTQNSESFDRMINTRLRMGWELYGNPMCVKDVYDEVWFMQMMGKRDA